MDNTTKPDTARASSPRRVDWRSWIGGTSMYGFELLLAIVGLLTVASIASYALFVLFNHWREASTSSAFTVPTGEFTLIIVASMIVWLPLALLFYLRARAEQVTRPVRTASNLHKILVGLFLIGVVMTIASLCFVVVYALLRLAVGMEGSVADILVRVVVPAVLSAGLFTGLLYAYRHNNRPTRKLYAIGLIVAGLLPVLVLLGVSFGQMRGAELDRQRASDLSTIQRQINQHVRDNGGLPDGLDDIDTDDVTRPLSEYRYEKQESSGFRSSGEYKLCATFSTDTRTGPGRTPSYGSDRPMSSTYANFRVHDKGEECFSLRASTLSSSRYDDLLNDRFQQDAINEERDLDA